MLFLKEHLEGFYQWDSETEKSVFEGKPSRRVFNRWNGMQVLFLINLILNESGTFSISEGKKIEKIIIDRLPIETKSELSVFNWLQQEIAKNNLSGEFVSH
jgi:hypothetical protein